jgi:hypothetical protein
VRQRDRLDPNVKVFEPLDVEHELDLASDCHRYGLPGTIEVGDNANACRSGIMSCGAFDYLFAALVSEFTNARLKVDVLLLAQRRQPIVLRAFLNKYFQMIVWQDDRRVDLELRDFEFRQLVFDFKISDPVDDVDRRISGFHRVVDDRLDSAAIVEVVGRN